LPLRERDAKDEGEGPPTPPRSMMIASSIRVTTLSW
jgi:hypothetical protein